MARVPAGRRIYAIGDVHGRLDLLERLLEVIAADSAGSPPAHLAVIFLGDLIDRGPQSRGVVERVAAGPPPHGPLAAAEWVALCGNHEDYLLTYSYWRDFTPERQLHRVSWVVGALINETAGQALVQTTDGGISFDPKKGADVTADLKAWVVAHPNMSQADLLAETLKTSTDWKVLQQGAQSALQLKRSNVLRALTDRLGSMVVQKNDYYAEGQLAKTIFRSGLPLAPEARGWVKSPNPELRFWAALILVRDGDVKNGEGLDVLEQYLESSPGVEGYLQAAETLLASPSRKASAVTVGVFQPKYYESLRESSFRGSDLLKRYFLAGKKECCDFLMAQMDDLKVDPNVISSSGRPAFLSDALVDQISCWYDVRNSYGEAMNKSETEEKLYRAKLKLWLVAQFALDQAGQKCAIRPPQSDLNYVTFIDQR